MYASKIINICPRA